MTTDVLSDLKAAFGEFAATGKELRSELDRVQAELAAEKRARELAETRAARPGGPGSPVAGAAAPGIIQTRGSLDPEFRSALTAYARTGAIEQRALTGTSGATGGFGVAVQYDTQVLDTLIPMSPMRRIARSLRVDQGNDIKVPVGRRGASSAWVGEDSTRTATNTPVLAQVTVPGGEVESYTESTQWLLDDAFFNVEEWLLRNVLDEHLSAEGAAFISGDGTNKPRGLLAGPTPVTTADSSRASGTLKYVPSGQAAALPTSMDELISFAYDLSSPYRTNAVWLLNSATMKLLMQYKSTTNEYLWQPSLIAGQPERFLGWPVVIDENMPDVGANAFPIAFGDFSRGYIVADRIGSRLVRDPFTKPGFVKFYNYRRVHGTVLDSNAIRLLKIATS